MANPTRTIQALEQRVRNESETIPVNMLREVMQNFQFRLQKCIDINKIHLAKVV